MWKSSSITLLQGQPAKSFVIYALKTSALSEEAQPIYSVQYFTSQMTKKMCMYVAQVSVLHIK